MFERFAEGRLVKVLSGLDEFTRECLAIVVDTSLQADAVTGLLRLAFRRAGVPEFLRSDNGSEFTAAEVQAWLTAHHVGPVFIAPGHPWQNGFIGSYHAKLRDECLNREWSESLAEARIVIEKWRRLYNTRRPHSPLGYQTPAQFAAAHKSKR